MDVGRREDQLLDKISDLVRQRKQAISTCLDFAEANPDLAVTMEWICTVGLEATEKEMTRT